MKQRIAIQVVDVLIAVGLFAFGFWLFRDVCGWADDWALGAAIVLALVNPRESA